jgi:hypothetical protein
MRRVPWNAAQIRQRFLEFFRAAPSVWCKSSRLPSAFYVTDDYSRRFSKNTAGQDSIHAV